MGNMTTVHSGTESANYRLINFFLLSFLVWPLTLKLCRCRGYRCICYTQWHTHTHPHIYTITRTPLDEGTYRRQDLYQTTHNNHNRKTSMSMMGFEPTIPTSERPQTHALNCAATGIVRFVTSCAGCVSIWLQAHLLIYKMFATWSWMSYFMWIKLHRKTLL